jgi:predicted DCC family thiol-disulfide oxidoreductase YuxK
VTTEYTDNTKAYGWVLYDAGCGFCAAWAKRFQAPLARRRLELLPLQTPWVRAKLGLADAELLGEMRVLYPDGEIIGGADALLEISRHFWWAWPIRQLSHVPGMLKLFRAGYRWVARHRQCTNGECGLGKTLVVKRSQPFLDFVPLLVLPLLVLLFQTRLEPWVFMWAMFMLLVTASPLFWLFHPPFITNVILPMLTAIGAT